MKIEFLRWVFLSFKKMFQVWEVFFKYFGWLNQHFSSAVMLEFDKCLYYHKYLLMAGNGRKCL